MGKQSQTAAGQSGIRPACYWSATVSNKTIPTGHCVGFLWYSDDEEEQLHTAQPVWRLTAVAVPLIHRVGRVRRARAKAGGTRWHN